MLNSKDRIYQLESRNAIIQQFNNEKIQRFVIREISSEGYVPVSVEMTAVGVAILETSSWSSNAKV